MAKLCAGYETSGWTVGPQSAHSPANNEGPPARPGGGTFVRDAYRRKSVAAT
ncbi:hypothetical protein GCM10009641_25670 [Mycobacterium cookii]|uniref:Uncharacterized protein n=1 Tax=Mycobacterium cookii TaxID=1775 RepID=A0A7I7KT97_9MYCO|nr:hypothetical protein MCOO_08560 [Mycobacterium cookii]